MIYYTGGENTKIKYPILILIIILFLSINVINATDPTDVGTFTNLQDDINSAGDSFNLTRNYTYDSSVDSITEITINKTITINGNNCTINGNNAAKIFVINASNVNLNNINFANGKATGNTYNDYASTITFDSQEHGYDNLTIINCTFINSFSDGSGGAILSKGLTLNIINCTFENNTANKRGGAVYSKGKANIENSKFINNGVIMNSTYYTPNSGEGGALWLGNSSNITNSTFENNFANYSGGAILFNGSDSNIIDCKFINNSVHREFGGAIYFKGNENFYVINCLFDGNYNGPYTGRSSKSGGAIASNASNVNIIKSNFTNNHMDEISTYKGYGSAIFISKDASTTLINDSLFENNSANAGAICSYGSDTLIINSTFNTNFVEDNGGAIYADYGSLEIYNSTFNSNNASAGGAVYIDEDMLSMLLMNSTFEDNSAETQGGAVYFDASSSVVNCVFNNNTVIAGAGGGIYIEYFGDPEVLVANSTFNGNVARYGGAINFDGVSLDVYNSTFISNRAVGVDVGGGAISAEGEFLSIFNSTFIENSANSGGAIGYTGSEMVNVYNSTFISNKALDDCGAFYAEYGCLVDNSNFFNNTAQDCAGAIGILDNSIINNSKFDGNKANKGSAIYILKNYELYIANTIFGKNRANSTDLTIDVNDLYVHSEDVIIAIYFEGNDNIANAIWNANEDPDYVTVNNITYEVFINGIFYNKTTNATDVHPVSGYEESNNGEDIWQDTLADSQLINLKVVDDEGDVVLDETGILTDIAGNITRVLVDPEVGEYTVYANHLNDAYYTNISATDEFEVIELLTTEKSTTDTSVEINDDVTYTITIKNTGDEVLSNITVIENTPDGFILKDYSSDLWDNEGDVTFKYHNSLDLNETITLTLTFTATKAGSFTNTINISSNNTDSTEITSNTVTVSNHDEPVHHPNIKVTKIAENDTILVGDKAVFIINVTNTGDEILTNVFVIEDFDNELIFDNFTSIVGDWNLNIVSGEYIFSLPSLGISSSASFKVYFNTTKAGNMINNATVGFETTTKAKTSTNITIEKIPTSIIVENITTNPGKTITIPITLKSANNTTINGNITINLPDGTNQTVEIINGTGNITFTVPENNAQKYNITVKYGGSDIYEPSNATIVINVIPKISTKITLENITCKPGDNITIPVNVTTDNETPFNGNITVQLPDNTNQTIEIINNNGNVKWNVPNNYNGTYEVYASFEGNEYYSASNTTSFIKVSKVPTTIIIGNITCKPGDNITIPINITTDDTTPFNGNITIVLPDGTTKTVEIINGKGNIEWNVPQDYEGIYEIYAYYDGNNYYIASNTTAYIIVVNDTKPSNKTPTQELSNNMLNDKVTGNPLIALLVALTLFGLSIKRRK